ncbi:MAG: hypothetical protein QOI98_767, partial [Solirubrobacteraceae bacterium]|nr:hypothetical protein [Solirubrobacteraceae bacterium]
MVSVEQRAEVRRVHFVDASGIREIRRRTGLHRDTIRRALRSSELGVARLAFHTRGFLAHLRDLFFGFLELVDR